MAKIKGKYIGNLLEYIVNQVMTQGEGKYLNPKGRESELTFRLNGFFIKYLLKHDIFKIKQKTLDKFVKTHCEFKFILNN